MNIAPEKIIKAMMLVCRNYFSSIPGGDASLTQLFRVACIFFPLPYRSLPQGFIMFMVVHYCRHPAMMPEGEERA